MAKRGKAKSVEVTEDQVQEPTEGDVTDEIVEATEEGNEESPTMDQEADQPEESISEEKPKKKKSGKFIVLSRIKEGGKVYNTGDTYEGENVDILLKSKVIEEN